MVLRIHLLAFPKALKLQNGGLAATQISLVEFYATKMKLNNQNKLGSAFLDWHVMIRNHRRV